MTNPLLPVPSSVYRIQFCAEFPLNKAIELLSYFHDLGIEGIYGSPVFVSGQSHGYDVVDPLHLNPLLGTMEDFEQFISLLKKYDMKYVFDVVPNHMGLKNNIWWNDVLEKGVNSPFSEFFDIDWIPEKPQLQGKVLLPFLHDFYGRVLKSGMIQLIWQEGFWATYQDHKFPISLFTYPDILQYSVEDKSLSEAETKDWLECLDIAAHITRLSQEKNGHEKAHPQKERLQTIYQRSFFLQKRIEQILEIFNKKRDLLHALLEKQYYRLSYWAVAGQEINYRRFFNINDLAAIHIEKKSVLDTHHRWIFNLIESQKVQGLRIDHPDGLYDPKEYFERLQSKKPGFVIIEKILDFKEKLPETWNIQGTVGYDFLNVLNGLFVSQKNEKKMSAIYEAFTGQTTDFEDLLYERKKWYIIEQLASEINSLGWRLDQLSEKHQDYRDFTRIDLTRALKEIIACFPVYRTYVSPDGKSLEKGREYVIRAVEKAQLHMPDIDPSLYAYIRELLLADWPVLDESQNDFLDFTLRFQQLTAPAMAKGLEDSCFYIYNRLISLNEVGGNPQNFGISTTEFHNFNIEKLEKWPLGFLATSTHDTKCSEDVRFRINVLSEIPDKWKDHVNLWKKINHTHKKLLHHHLFPDANTEYYLYQMLLGLWPISKERLFACMQKAVRQAGIHTSWRWPNEDYESILQHFLDSILTSTPENAFLPSFLAFQQEIAHYGTWNSLAALVLKMGSCGIVDIYQGNELDNLCMMDPDNRALIDYERRKEELYRLKDQIDCATTQPILNVNPLSQHNSHSYKLLLTSLCLNYRRLHKELFLKGSYTPLKIQGKYHEEVIAFLRSYENTHVLVVTSRFFTHFSSLPLKEIWEDTHIVLPKHLLEDRELVDLFTGNKVNLQKARKNYHLFISKLFQTIPIAILIHTQKNASHL